MKILKLLLGIVALLVVILGILTFAMSTEFAVEREIVINKPKAEVFKYLKAVKNQNAWSPWLKKDPKTKQTFEGTDGTEGFIYKWESDHSEVGSGEQEIKKIVEGERIDSELRFKNPFESVSPAYFVTESAGENKTKIIWGFSGSMPRPWNLMNLLWNIEEMAGKEFEAGLADLKIELEKRVSPKRVDSENDTDIRTDGEKNTIDNSNK